MNYYISFLIVLLFSGCSPSGPIIELPEAKIIMRQVNPLIDKIERYKTIKGSYPLEIYQLPLDQSDREVIKSRGLTYSQNDSTQFELSFRFTHGISNPICSYWSDLKKWQCLLK